MRTGICAAVLSGDTILLDRGGTRLRYCNVWAPALGTPIGDALKEYNQKLVLGKALRYLPNGHVHWDSAAIIADVYVADPSQGVEKSLWVNQELRFWLARRIKAPVWQDGIPGDDNPATL